MEDREEEINSEKKIPDNVVPHPNSLPYASDLAAPVIFSSSYIYINGDGV